MVNKLPEETEDLLVMVGFDEAIAGIVYDYSGNRRVCYDTEKVLGILMGSGMNREEAEEYHVFKQVGAYMGEGTPVFIELIEERVETASKEIV